MSVRFESELNEFRKRGITLADMTGDEVEELVLAVARVRNPFSDVNMDALGEPLYNANGLTLYALTIGGVVWLEEYAKKWFANRPKAYFWAIIYALMHGREKDAFKSMTNEDAAYSAIKEMGLKLCVTQAELSDAIDVALDFRRPTYKTKRTADEGIDWAGIIATMEANTGIPAEKWIWDRSADYVIRAYNSMTQFAAKQAGGTAARMRDELDHALNALAAVRMKIVARIEEARAIEKARAEAQA